MTNKEQKYSSPDQRQPVELWSRNLLLCQVGGLWRGASASARRGNKTNFLVCQVRRVSTGLTRQRNAAAGGKGVWTRARQPFGWP